MLFFATTVAGTFYLHRRILPRTGARAGLLQSCESLLVFANKSQWNLGTPCWNFYRLVAQETVSMLLTAQAAKSPIHTYFLSPAPEKDKSQLLLQATQFLSSTSRCLQSIFLLADAPDSCRLLFQSNSTCSLSCFELHHWLRSLRFWRRHLDSVRYFGVWCLDV